MRKQVLSAILLFTFAQLPAFAAQENQDFIQSSTEAKKIEFYWSKPAGQGPFPLLLLIHPDQDSPKIGGKVFIEMGQLEYWSKKGFVTVAISQPGYGASEGPADFCGPHTQAAALEVLSFFRAKKELVSKRIFIYGGSRGAVVASMLAAKAPELSGVILKSGVYNFVEWTRVTSWFNPIKLTLLWEMGWPTEEKLKARSAIFLADNIKAPTLIIHGTHDSRAPLSIAEELSENINRAGGKAQLVKIDSEHVIPMTKVNELMETFMK